MCFDTRVMCAQNAFFSHLEEHYVFWTHSGFFQSSIHKLPLKWHSNYTFEIFTLFCCLFVVLFATWFCTLNFHSLAPLSRGTDVLQLCLDVAWLNQEWMERGWFTCFLLSRQWRSWIPFVRYSTAQSKHMLCKETRHPNPSCNMCTIAYFCMAQIYWPTGTMKMEIEVYSYQIFYQLFNTVCSCLFR